MAEINVTGLRELRSELRALDGQWPKELRKVNLAIAQRIAGKAKATYSSMGRSAPKVAPTVKALAQQTQAEIKVGGGSSIGALVTMGNTWGSVKYKQFPRKREGGYALFPAIKDDREQIIRDYLKMIDDLVARAFPD